MKKSLSLILSLVMLFSVLTAIPFSASALPDSGILDENTAYSFEPALGELTIYGDSSIATRDFNTGSKPSPFKDNTEIKKVVIQGALGIGDCTFYGCTNLKEVTFTRKSTQTIGSSAFHDCTALETVNFASEGTGITTIYEGAFSGCSSLKRINLPVTVNMIYSTAFKDCSSLQSVYIPNADCSFSSNAFENCTSLTSFSMPLNSVHVDVDMFRNCTSLTKLAIPYVPSYAFFDNALNGCTALTDIYFGGTQEQWSVYAKPGNNPLNSAAVHYNCRYGRCGDDAEFVYDIAKKELTISGTGVTYGNKHPTDEDGPGGADLLWYPYKDDIESVVIEEGITGIGHHNFADESNLKSITVPKSLEGFGRNAFINCNAFTDIYYAGTESEWNSVGYHPSNSGALATATKHYSGCSHNYSSSVTEPTCTEKGYTTYTCSLCGDSYVGDETAALGHDMEIDEVGREATCTENGNLPYCYCKRCQKYFIDSLGENEIEGLPVIEAKGHDYEAVTTAPTCTAKGYTIHTCSRCKDSYKDSYKDAKGHTWNSGKITATTSTTYTTTYTCTLCKATKKTTSDKKTNPMKASGKTAALKYSDVKKKTQTVKQSKAFTVSKAQGKVTYKKSSGNSKITVSSAGKITVKKGLKKGTYKVKVKVTAAGNNTYKKTTKTVTVTIKVK